MKREDVVGGELVALLRGGNAHMTFEDAVAGFPIDRINDKAPHMPYSAFHILEHMRLVQKDIVVFIQDAEYVSPEWPRDYFPKPNEKADAQKWHKTIREFRSDREILIKMASDKKIDLMAPIAHAADYTIFRELLLAADHNAYHTGELALMRQVLEVWAPGQVLYDAK